ncbi:trimeric LpxA-like protein, partial [Fragilariopsis cylindrus CCMP1102]
MAFHAMTNDTTIAESACADLDRFVIMDPAAEGMLKIFLFFKGYHAVQCARIAHYFWLLQEQDNNSKWIASALQSDMSDTFGVDIHPGAKWGKGITMDHGTGCVIGETSVIGDNVYLMHGVTLGATGTSDQQDRHPKVGRGVFIAANATILGNITIGDGAVVGASSLVLNIDVPAGYTAVGIPARLL